MPNSFPPQFFFHPTFGEVRTIVKNDEPWFVAKDACACLGLDTSNLSKVLDDDERATSSVESTGQARAMSIISESGLYSLVLRSRKPEAKRFRKWVTAEVLPSPAIKS